MNVKTVIFDLDGTLLDTLGDLADATNAALRRHGYPTRTDGEIRAFVGNGIRNLMQRALPSGADDDAISACLADFRAHYDAHMMCRTAPYPGIPELLAALRKRGIRMGVLSNKYDPASRALAAHYFPGLIDQTFGERPGVPRKPDPASTRELLQTLGAAQETTLYVGDSGVDMETAQNAGLYAVGVTWGFRGRSVLAEAGADALIDHPLELLALLD
ncbi:MAG: HAD family hydrolase [Intestinibacillus sp.]